MAKSSVNRPTGPRQAPPASPPAEEDRVARRLRDFERQRGIDPRNSPKPEEPAQEPTRDETIPDTTPTEPDE